MSFASMLPIPAVCVFSARAGKKGRKQREAEKADRGKRPEDEEEEEGNRKLLHACARAFAA